MPLSKLSKSRLSEKNRKETNKLLTQKLQTNFLDEKPALTMMMTDRLVSSSNSEQLEAFDAMESLVSDKVH